MRFCKLIPLDTFSIIQSLSGKPTHTLHDPHQPTALTLKVKLHLLTFPELVERSPWLLHREVVTP